MMQRDAMPEPPLVAGNVHSSLERRPLWICKSDKNSLEKALGLEN